MIDGTQAEYVRVPFADTSTYKVPADVSDEEILMLADILPTSYEVGVLNGRVAPGDTVAIVGAGPIGLSAILGARMFSPGHVIAIDLADTRLEAAKAFGADLTVNNGRADAVSFVHEVTEGLGADVAIEAVGVPATHPPPPAGMTQPAPDGATLAPIRATAPPRLAICMLCSKRQGCRRPMCWWAESSAALDARVFTGFYPAEVAGLVLVNWCRSAIFLSALGAATVGRGPGFVSRSQDASARIIQPDRAIPVWVGQPLRSRAPAQRNDASAEWNTIWHLTQAPKARAALIQDIASRQRSSAEARAAGSLGGRPLVVVSSENIEPASAHPGLWMELQTDLARLSTHGKAIVVEGGSDLVYQSPGAVIEAVRQVLSAVGDPTLR